MTHEEMEARVSLHLGEGLAGWVADQLEPVLVQDVTNDPRWMHVDGIDDHVRAAISAPFTVAEQLLGVISVLSPLPGAFLPEHLDLLLAICQEIGLALSNARQYQQVQRRLAEITLIQNLAEIFNRRLDLQNLLDEVVLQLVQRFGYPRVEIYLVEEDGLAQRAHYGKSHDDLNNALLCGDCGQGCSYRSDCACAGCFHGPGLLPCRGRNRR